MTLDFGGVLRRAWTLTWNNKILWLFGIFSALMAGQANGSNSNFRFDFNDPGRSLPPQMQDLGQNVILLIILAAVVIGIIVAIVLLILSVFGRGGLIGGINLANKQGRVSFGEAWAIGQRKFWTVLAIGLVLWVVGLVLAGASLITFLTVCLAPLACVGFILIALLGVFARLAQIVAVTEDVGVSEALPRAWRFVTANLGSLFLMGLILLVIQFVVALVLGAPVVLIAGPAILAAIGYANDSQLAGGAGLALAGLCVVVYIPILIVARGILESWLMAAWTLTYQQLTGRAPAAVVPAPTPA
jgi:hypothetical protein